MLLLKRNCSGVDDLVVLGVGGETRTFLPIKALVPKAIGTGINHFALDFRF